MALFSLGQPREALPDLDRALRATPDDPGARAIRSEVHLLLGNDAEALADLDRLLEAEPEEAWALVYRAQVRLMTGDPGEALGDVERALARQPDHAAASVIAGVAHRLAGRTAEAEAHWARALTRLTEETAESVEDFEPWGNLFLLHCARRDEESAVAARRGFLAAEPEPGSLQQWLAALDRFRRLLDLDPDWVAELARPLQERLSEGGGGA
ncbi:MULTISPECIES: tetratricopeptide repeat protein [Streptomyces]|nr:MULTISPECIES: tetratricopeptide repeat protein [Streptomyces]